MIESSSMVEQETISFWSQFPNEVWIVIAAIVATTGTFFLQRYFYGKRQKDEKKKEDSNNDIDRKKPQIDCSGDAKYLWSNFPPNFTKPDKYPQAHVYYEIINRSSIKAEGVQIKFEMPLLCNWNIETEDSILETSEIDVEDVLWTTTLITKKLDLWPHKKIRFIFWPRDWDWKFRDKISIKSKNTDLFNYKFHNESPV